MTSTTTEDYIKMENITITEPNSYVNMTTSLQDEERDDVMVPKSQRGI